MPGNRNIKLRVKTGIFKGCEGYIVRIDRDRQLVFGSGGYAVASRGVHQEDFEVVKELFCNEDKYNF